MPTLSRVRSTARILSCGLLAAALAAQGPVFVDLHVPGGVLAGGVQANGKLVVYRNGTFLRVFSAVTHRWHALDASAGTTVTPTKDLVLVPESDRWTGFSAYTGASATVFLPFAATTLTTHDSVACVQHAGTIYAFSAFTGQWHARAMPSGWQLALGNRVALIHSSFLAPAAASAFDVYTGQWHDIPAQTGNAFRIDVTGDAAVVSTTTMQFGFSALRGGWQSTPVAATFPFPPMQIVVQDRMQARGVDAVFSSLSGTFVPVPFSGTNGFVDLRDNIALASTSIGKYVAGAGQNVWIPAPATPFVAIGESLATAGGSGLLHAFSPYAGTWTATPWTAGGTSSASIGRDAVGCYDQTTDERRVFSTFTAAWHTPPAGALAETPVVTGASAVLRTGTGMIGFAGHSGTFVALPGATVRHNGYVASDASSLHVFDPLAARWVTQPWQAGAGIGPVFGARTMLATDGTHVLGHSSQSREFARQALPEAGLAVLAADDVGVVRTNEHLVAFAGLGSTVGWQGAPEGPFSAAPGATATLQLTVPAQHIAVFGFGAPVPPTPTPHGELWIDPDSSLVVILGSVPADQRLVLPIPVPNIASLRGSVWVQQMATVAADGTIEIGAPNTMLLQ